MNSFDQTTIEESLKSALTDIFGSTYKIYNSRPSSTSSTNDSFIVAKVSGSITDLSTYGKCTCGIHLFTKDLAGMKNTKKLSKMYSTLISGLASANGRLIFDINPTVVGDVPDDYGYTVRIINLQTTIKLQ